MLVKNLNKLFFLVLLLPLQKAFPNPVRVLTEHLPPFQIVADKQVNGAATEIVQTTFEAAGIDFEITPYPWAISYNRTLREPGTCLYSVARLPSRESEMLWIGWIATLETHFYTSALRNIAISSVAQARKFKVAAIKDDAAHHFLLSQGFIENENLYVHQNYQSLLKLLDIRSRNIDLVMLSETLLNYRAKEGYQKSHYKKLLRVEELTLKFHLACHLDTDATVVNKLTNSMMQLERTGVLSAIRKRWNISGL